MWGLRYSGGAFEGALWQWYYQSATLFMNILFIYLLICSFCFAPFAPFGRFVFLAIENWQWGRLCANCGWAAGTIFIITPAQTMEWASELRRRLSSHLFTFARANNNAPHTQIDRQYMNPRAGLLSRLFGQYASLTRWLWNHMWAYLFYAQRSRLGAVIIQMEQMEQLWSHALYEFCNNNKCKWIENFCFVVDFSSLIRASL